MSTDRYPTTPDGRYFVVRGRLWRTTNPALPAEARNKLVADLMNARRAVRDAKGDDFALAGARAQVHTAKLALGERGRVWWTDDAPDLNRRMVRNTPYANWFATLGETSGSGRGLACGSSTSGDCDQLRGEE